MDRETRNQIELEEFVLVNNTIPFEIKDVIINKIDVGKNGVVYEILDKDNQKIGLVRENKKFEFDKNYKSNLKKKMGKYFEALNLDSEDIEVDILEMIRLQEEKDKLRMQEQNINEQASKDDTKKIENKEEKKKDNSEQLKNTNSQVIDDKKLKKSGYKIITSSKIKDQSVIDSVLSGAKFDPRTMIIAEVEGREGPVLLAKEKGTGEYIEIQQRKGVGIPSGPINKFENGVERQKRRGTSMEITDLNRTRFNVSKVNGRLEVDVLKDVDNDGREDAIAVETDNRKVRYEEYRRLHDEMSTIENEIDDDEILTKEEIERILENENDEIKFNVMEQVNSMEKNPTKGQLDEMIENEKDESEKVEDKNKDEGKTREDEIEEDEDFIWGLPRRRRH